MLFSHTKQLLFFYRQLAQMISAGLPITDALNSLISNSNKQKDRATLIELKAKIEHGSSLSQAMRDSPTVFALWQVSVIKAAETSGKLPQTLEKLAFTIEKDLKNLQYLLVGFAYPILLLHIAFFAFPIVTLISSGVLAYITEVAKSALVFYCLVFLAIGLKKLGNQKAVKPVFDFINVNLPIFGKIVKNLLLIRFMRALEALTSSGVNILTAWKEASDTCGNITIKQALLNGLNPLKNSQNLKDAFIQTNVFPASILGMIATAEASGSIPKMLGSVAGYLEQDSKTSIQTLLIVLPIILYVTIAVYIASRIIGFYTDYFSKSFGGY